MATFSMNDYWEAQGQIPTLADVEDGLEAGDGIGLTISGIDRGDMGSGASLITIADNAPSSPVNGEIWNKTATPTGEPSVRGMVYDSASTQWLGYPIFYSDTEPSTTGLKTGVLWYDKYTKVLRVYREAAYDPDGIAGFHPISAGYQLWKNKSGGIVGPNKVVVQYSAGATDRGFTTSTVVKAQHVVGVTLATVGSDGYGLIATVAGGAPVSIACNVTDGNIAIGDGIVQSGTAGEGRTCGGLPAGANATAGVQHSGMPLGCFAVALEAVTTATITKCRLLGRIGEGATYRKASTTVAAFADGLANLNWDGGWDEVNLSGYPPPGGVNDFITEAKHKPIAAVLMSVDAAMDSTDAGTVSLALDLNLGPDASTTLVNVHMDGEHNNNANLGMQAVVTVPTSGGTPYTALGQKFYWSGTKSAGAGTAAVTAANFKAHGYIY